MTTKTRILIALQLRPMTVDEIAAATNLTPAQVAAPVTSLYQRGSLTREKVYVDGIVRSRFRYTRADAPTT